LGGVARVGLVTVASVLMCSPVTAATFIVVNTNDAGAGSLRQAILQANTNGIADTIEFQITNATRTLTVTSALPAIGEPVTLTGATQPGYVNAPIVELNGNNLAADGLRLQTSSSTIRALVINRFNGDGIEIVGGAGNVVEGCVIGLNLAGGLDQGNTLNGIVLSNAPNKHHRRHCHGRAELHQRQYPGRRAHRRHERAFQCRRWKHDRSERQ
jgi:hypothetical protein